jgi:hypothetical protein
MPKHLTSQTARARLAFHLASPPKPAEEEEEEGGGRRVAEG